MDQKYMLYMVWRGMKIRCYNKSHSAYKDYGGRGIKICDDWHYSFNKFFDWCINNGWEKGLTIDRYPDNNGGYNQNNCRFVSIKEQQRNKRSNIYVTIFGETKCISAWLEDYRCEVTESKFRHRIKVGYDPEYSLINSKIKSKFKRGDLNYQLPFKQEEAVGYFTLTGKFKRIKRSLHVECVCVCGNIQYREFKHIKTGRSVSCGCMRGFNISSTKSNNRKINLNECQ